jgi:3-keto-disaccharide hydrolase
MLLRLSTVALAMVVLPTVIHAAEKVSTNPPSLKSSGWESLFDGKTLKGWKPTDFAGRGEVKVKDGQIIMEMGVMTGITWTNPVTRMNYEISLEAMRVEGGDFFCGLTFPVGDDPCSLIVGGWGGGVVGLSSLDGNDASSNETTQYINFQKGKWYLIQLRVTPGRIQAWLDGDSLLDVETKGKKISIRSEMDDSLPLGVATWATTGALRNFKIRKL